MKVQRMMLFPLVLSIVLFSGCGSSKSHKKALFGVSKDSPISSMAVIDWKPTYTRLANGVYVTPVREGAKDEFSTATTIFVPPGDYLVSVQWLGIVAEHRRGNVTVRNSVLHNVPVGAKPGMKYTLQRVGYGKSEKISVIETPMDTR
jgi:hypothetical protein